VNQINKSTAPPTNQPSHQQINHPMEGRMNDYLFPYERLQTWQDARTLVKSVYELTGTFPGTEKFGLVSQLNRAAVSVASNLAEGSSRTSFKDQGHFSQLAYSSLMEVACQITLTSDLMYVTQSDLLNMRQDISVLANKINALRKSQLKRAKDKLNCAGAR
jgi:four helix bundle protein